MSVRYSRLLWVAFFATLFAVAVLLLPGTATPTNADFPGTYRYCGSIPQQTFPWPDGTSVILSQWNKTALGIPNATLTSVDVTATMWITQDFSAENTQPVAGYVKGNTNANLDIYGPNNPVASGIPIFSDFGSTNIVSSTLQAAGPGEPPSDGKGTDYKQWPTGFYNNTGAANDPTIAPYKGSGTVTFPTTGVANFTSTGGLGNLTTILTTTARATICVIYSYTNPTAVTLSSFTADANTSNPMLFAGAGLLVVGMLGLAGWKLTH